MPASFLQRGRSRAGDDFEFEQTALLRNCCPDDFSC